MPIDPSGPARGHGSTKPGVTATGRQADTGTQPLQLFDQLQEVVLYVVEYFNVWENAYLIFTTYM